MNWQTFIDWAVIGAGVGAIASAIAAWILVVFTKRQVAAIEVDYREARAADLAAQLTARDQVEALFKDWKQTMEGRSDILSSAIDKLESSIVSEDSFSEVLSSVEGQSFSVTNVNSMGLSKLRPAFAISASRIHQQMEDISEELGGISDVFPAELEDVNEAAKSASSYMKQIRSDIDGTVRSIDDVLKYQKDDIRALRDRYDRAQQMLNDRRKKKFLHA